MNSVLVRLLQCILVSSLEQFFFTEMSTTTATSKRGIIGQVGYCPKGQTDHHFLMYFFACFYADNYVMKITFFPLKIVMLNRFFSSNNSAKISCS